MVLDPSASSVQTNSRTERPTTYATEKEPDRAKAERPETGQTSEANPAVVTNISAAALEAARAVTPPEQGAEQERAANAVENTDRGQSESSRMQERGRELALEQSKRTAGEVETRRERIAQEAAVRQERIDRETEARRQRQQIDVMA